MQHRSGIRAPALIVLFPRLGEALLATTSVAIACFCLPLAMFRGTEVDLPSILTRLLLPGLFFVVGVAYRLSGRSERIASALIAVSLLAAFSLTLAVYNHLLLPVSAPLIDPLLFRFNAVVGYDWSAWVDWGARNPMQSAALAHVYESSLAQVVVLLAALGLTNRLTELDRMMTTIAIGSLATVCFWSLFPSISVSAFIATDPKMEEAASLTLGRAVGEHLLQVVTYGIDRISPETMTGLIGFPSFHTVLALVCMRFAWTLPPARWPFVAINVVMFPAILLHGSHHVADVVGGIVTFGLALWGAERLLRLESADPSTAALRPVR